MGWNWPEYGPMIGNVAKNKPTVTLDWVSVCVSSAVTNNSPERPENGADKRRNAS